MIHVFINGRLAKKQDVILSSESLLNTLCPNCNATVDVNIEILTKVDENLAGYCWGDSEHIEIELARKSNDYTYTREEFLLNLTHELVHAKQLINKQFVDIDLQILSNKLQYFHLQELKILLIQ